MIGYVERLVQFALPVDYCSPCRLKALANTVRLKKVELTQCEKTDGKECNYIGREPPYQVHPDNWLPLFLYKKIRKLSPLRSIQLGHASNVRREFSVEAMMIVISEYCPTISQARRLYLIEAIGEIYTVYAGAESSDISQRSDAANRERTKKPGSR